MRYAPASVCPGDLAEASSEVVEPGMDRLEQKEVGLKQKTHTQICHDLAFGLCSFMNVFFLYLDL